MVCLRFRIISCTNHPEQAWRRRGVLYTVYLCMGYPALILLDAAPAAVQVLGDLHQLEGVAAHDVFNSIVRELAFFYYRDCYGR